jgi:hypothetical protein
MKKLVTAALFLVCGTVMAFAQQETWISVGFEFGNFMEHYDGEASYSGSPGFNLNAYGFYEKQNIGMFAHYGFLSPVIMTGEQDLAGYGLQMELLIGPGFRYNFNDSLKLYFGIGIDWMPIFVEYAKDGKDHFGIVNNLGIGANTGIKYDITDFFYVSGGVTLAYLFYNHTSLYSHETTAHDLNVRTRIIDENIKGHGTFTVKPYLALGFNYYQEKAVWGKPKR